MGEGSPSKQNPQSPVIRPFVYCLAASVALNSMMILSADQVFFDGKQKAEILKSQRLLQDERDRLPFEFIETPVLAPAQKPARAKKMSNRDSVNRDPSKEKTITDRRPQIKNIGPSDQLEQLRAKPSQAPSIASEPQQETRKSEPAKKADASEDKEKEPSSDPGVPDQAPAAVPVKASTVATPAPNNQKQAAAQPSKPGTQEAAGLDRITTQATARAKSRGASLSGVTSYDAMGSDMGVYMKNVKERVWLAWFPYLSFQYPNDFQAADATILFTVDAKGEVKTVKVLDSYGSPLFSTFCTQVIQRASGFGEVPKEILALLGKDELEILFAFHYR